MLNFKIKVCEMKKENETRTNFLLLNFKIKVPEDLPEEYVRFWGFNMMLIFENRKM